jgi:hypothetical protein
MIDLHRIFRKIAVLAVGSIAVGGTLMLTAGGNAPPASQQAEMPRNGAARPRTADRAGPDESVTPDRSNERRARRAGLAVRLESENTAALGQPLRRRRAAGRHAARRGAALNVAAPVTAIGIALSSSAASRIGSPIVGCVGGDCSTRSVCTCRIGLTTADETSVEDVLRVDRHAPISHIEMNGRVVKRIARHV